jgi:hypothetical protein
MANRATMALEDIAGVRVNLETWRGQRYGRTPERSRPFATKKTIRRKDGIAICLDDLNMANDNHVLMAKVRQVKETHERQRVCH